MNRFALTAVVVAMTLAPGALAADQAQMVFRPDVYRAEQVIPAGLHAGDFRIVGAAAQSVVKQRIVSVREWGEYYGRTRNQVEYVDVVQVRVAYDGPPRRVHEYEPAMTTFNLPLESFDAATVTQLRSGLKADAAQGLFELDVTQRTEDRRVVDTAASDVREWDVVYRPRNERIVYKTAPVDMTVVKVRRK